jgi:AcrR family transcriptional regulator
MATASTPRKYEMKARAVAVAQNRERMLAAAWTQFAERPYEAVRLADVAAAAGATVQTLHSNFGPKEELFVAAWKWRMTPEGALRDSAPAGDAKRAVRILYDSYDRDGDAVLRLIAEEDRIPAVREMTDAGRAWHRGWVERTFPDIWDGITGTKRERRIAATVVATDLQVWRVLRREMRHPRQAAERIVVDMLIGLKGAP